ncbi:MULTISPECIES: alpha/beta hydrolase [Mycolicibacterium]|jgi:alpha-beta hydrolase superfamily lysophospholipase|uniref:alpha/beta hydrolase n=1 Tax=Mycolicibacterium TaxID=1866885 RepID=UPI000565FA9C|nr:MULTISPECIES: alpha/beta hydrolase [Mycolicibacterium]PQP46761.1 alpha/beta hydrolase [Mycolicibacterium austroafricanum]QZY47555.1 alpha/beta hydrolase [Mycolicibacterium austroafricanum]UJL31284.1 alpha/beta hydrolase [Mycolicibacterium vanbaalenii]WND58124.1 alpha/beta hydrolase [Mycolicibacterium vanbaalenii]
MNFQAYAGFVPGTYTDSLAPPVSTWWPWRGRTVHVARAAVPAAEVRAMVVHGGGGYSGALWPAAAVAAGDGVDVLAPDLPLYGDTVEPDPAGVRYDAWVDLLCDLVAAERAADPRPLILFGASMGGMLAYEVAARTRQVAAVVATCLLDMSDPAARAAATRFAWMGRPAPAVLRAVVPVFGRVRLPIRWLADMAAMSTDPRLSRLCAADPRGGGASVPLAFLSSWMNYRHAAPEHFDAAPVTLVAPAADTWTAPELSIRFLQRISGPTELVMLENCGHFPIEEPGLTQLRDAFTRVAERAARR